jgi:hypothetical protein
MVLLARIFRLSGLTGPPILLFESSQSCTYVTKPCQLSHTYAHNLMHTCISFLKFCNPHMLKSNTKKVNVGYYTLVAWITLNLKSVHSPFSKSLKGCLYGTWVETNQHAMCATICSTTGWVDWRAYDKGVVLNLVDRASEQSFRSISFCWVGEARAGGLS